MFELKKLNKNIILDINNLSIGYHDKNNNNIVASNINLSIEKGKLISILGKNGIGKSTFLRTISKVQKPIHGKILLNDININSYKISDIAKILSLVLTERLPESQLSVYEIIALGRQPYTNWLDKLSKEDIKKVNWAIKITEIENLIEKKFYELSDGQLQRVLIARAIAQDTEIIILDEPTAHLDLHNTIKILTLLKNLVKETQKTIIITSHEVNLALQLSDYIILFKDDKVVADSPNKLIESNNFENLFDSNLIEFNKELKQYIVKGN